MASKSRKTNPAKDALSVLSEDDLRTLRGFLQWKQRAAEAREMADAYAADVLKIVKASGPLMLGTQRVRVKKRKGWKDYPVEIIGLEAQIKEARKQAERAGLATATLTEFLEVEQITEAAAVPEKKPGLLARALGKGKKG